MIEANARIVEPPSHQDYSGTAEAEQSSRQVPTGASFATFDKSVSAPASILIADDDEISARFLKRLLLREGHAVTVVTTAEEVLAECASNPPDLVVIDLVAPRGLGFDVCRRLKDEPQTRFIPV